MHTAEIVVGLVVVATAVASLAGRLRAPAPSLLVLAGIAVALLPGVPAVHVSPAGVTTIVLPPLLIAAATDVALPELRKVAWQVGVLAVGLVAATAVAIAFAFHAVAPQVGLRPAFVVGAALASTDPVAVAALARRLQLPPRVLALVQGESLLNDATSLVLFTVAVSVTVSTGPVDLGSAVLQFVRLGFGGAAVGGVAAAMVVALHRRATEPVVDLAVAVVTPYAVYVAAQALGCSGVTAVVVCGLGLSDRRTRLYDGRTRLIIGDLYEVAVFLLESAIFAVIGLQLPGLVNDLPAGERHVVATVVVVTLTMLVVRLLWIFATAYLQPRRRRARDMRWQAPLVVTWAGTRGVVPLAAALSIPAVVHGGAGFPQRDFLLLVISAGIAVTLVVQGLTLQPLVRRFGVTVPAGRRAEQERLAREAAAAAALAWLDGAVDDAGSETERDAVERLRVEFGRRARHWDGDGDIDHRDSRSAYHRMRSELLEVQSAELLRLRDEGRISETARRRVQHSLDVEEAGLLDLGN